MKNRFLSHWRRGCPGRVDCSTRTVNDSTCRASGLRFPIDVILVCIRWYVAYPLSYRHIEEIMGARGVSVDHSTINRSAIRFLPLIEKLSRKHKRNVASNWRMDETYP